MYKKPFPNKTSDLELQFDVHDAPQKFSKVTKTSLSKISSQWDTLYNSPIISFAGPHGPSIRCSPAARLESASLQLPPTLAFTHRCRPRPCGAACHRVPSARSRPRALQPPPPPPESDEVMLCLVFPRNPTRRQTPPVDDTRSYRPREREGKIFKLLIIHGQR